ncbi:MAG: hypothetical protein R3C60_13925 [Parvularculaceae bacterium]
MIAIIRSQLSESQKQYGDELNFAQMALEYARDSHSKNLGEYVFGAGLAAHLSAALHLGLDDIRSEEAESFLDSASAVSTPVNQIRRSIAEVALALGQYRKTHGDQKAANLLFKIGVNSFDRTDQTQPELLVLEAALNSELGENEKARALMSDLGELSPIYPDYAALLEKPCCKDLAPAANRDLRAAAN